jgi:hypothetical protein
MKNHMSVIYKKMKQKPMYNRSFTNSLVSHTMSTVHNLICVNVGLSSIDVATQLFLPTADT